MHKNFNVILPLADLCLGTLLPRSKVRFAQPRGLGVPDVQPLRAGHGGALSDAAEPADDALSDSSTA
jgi:hypothetical protein